MEKRGNWPDDFSKGSWPGLPHPESSNQIPHSPAWRLSSHHETVVKAGGFSCSNSDVGKWRKLTPSAEELQTIWPRVLRLRRIRAISQVLPAPHSPALFSLLELRPGEKPLTEMPVRGDHGQMLANSPAIRASVQTPTYDLCLGSIFIFYFLKKKIKAHILSSHTVIPGNRFGVKEFWLLRAKTNTERFPAVPGALPVHGLSTSSCQNCYVAGGGQALRAGTRPYWQLKYSSWKSGLEVGQQLSECKKQPPNAGIKPPLRTSMGQPEARL